MLGLSSEGREAREEGVERGDRLELRVVWLEGDKAFFVDAFRFFDRVTIGMRRGNVALQVGRLSYRKGLISTVPLVLFSHYGPDDKDDICNSTSGESDNATGAIPAMSKGPTFVAYEWGIPKGRT